MSLLRQKSSSSLQHPLRTAAVIIVAIFVFIALARWSPISKIVYNIQARLYETSSEVNTFFVQVFSSSESLKSQINQYQEISASNLVDAAYVSELESRVQDLEDLLSYSQTVEYKTIAAKILSRSPSDSYTLLIDQGSEDGVKEGLAAVVNEGHLIGIVSSVSDYTATIRLLEDAQTRIPVRILGQDDTSGLLVGQEGFLLNMQYIPQDRELVIGDPVVTSNLHERIPDDLVIGTIYEIIKDETSSFQEAYIEPIYRSGAYANVLIVDTTNVKIYEE